MYKAWKKTKTSTKNAEGHTQYRDSSGKMAHEYLFHETLILAASTPITFFHSMDRDNLIFIFIEQFSKRNDSANNEDTEGSKHPH